MGDLSGNPRYSDPVEDFQLIHVYDLSSAFAQMVAFACVSDRVKILTSLKIIYIQITKYQKYEKYIRSTTHMLK